MRERNKKEAKKFALEMLEKEMLHMKGRQRQKAMRRYHRILSSLAEEPIYFVRS